MLHFRLHSKSDRLLGDDQPGRFALPGPLLNFTLTKRFRAACAQIIVDLLVRQNEQQTLTNGHRASALSAVQRGSAEVFELAHLILREEVAFPPAHDVGNDRIEDHDWRLGGVDVHDQVVAVVVKQWL